MKQSSGRQGRLRGNHTARRFTPRPPTSACETQEHLEGKPPVEIDCRLSPQDAVARPTPQSVLVNGAGLFVRHVDPLRRVASVHDPAGLTGARAAPCSWPGFAPEPEL